MGGGSASFQSLLQTLGGSIVFYHPLSDAGPYGTTYPGSGTVSMPLGTMTNKSYGGPAVSDGRVTYQDGGFTSPDGVGVIKLHTPGGVSTIVNCHDTTLWSAAVNIGLWVKVNPSETSTDINLGGIAASGSRNTDIRIRPGSDQIWMQFNAVNANYALTKATMTAGMLIGITAYDTGGTDTNQELYVNGVLLGTLTRTGLKQCAAQNRSSPSDSWNYGGYSGSTHSGHISGEFLVKDVQYTAADWLKLYNAGK